MLFVLFTAGFLAIVLGIAALAPRQWQADAEFLRQTLAEKLEATEEAQLVKQHRSR